MARKTRGLLSICFKGVYMISFKKICKLVFSFLITALVLFSYFHLNEVSALVVDENLISENENKVDYYEFVDSLKNAYSNDDIVGKIRIDGTFLDEVIVQGNDNSYYLSHDNYKNYNIAGSLFVDSRVNLDDDKKILIYGHNSPKGDRPFSVLEEYYDYEYFKEHPIVELTTDDVWDVLLRLDGGKTPWGSNNNELVALYADADSGVL